MSAKQQLSGEELRKRRKQVEGIATFGLILICVALVSPFWDPSNLRLLSIFRWIYGAGALIYVIARATDVSDPNESFRLKRMRRMELWAGISFCIATGFWFYDQYHLGEYAGVVAALRNTVLFTLVGALIQIIASWMIYMRSKKEMKDRT